MSKVAIITGGSRGIGKAISIKLASLGIYVIINYLKNDEEANKTLKEINDMGYSCELYKGDVSDFNVAKSLVDYTIKRCGKLDMLINNAGVSYHGLLMDMTEESFDWIINVNLKSAFNMTRHSIIPLLKTSGSILNISSIWSDKGAANEVVYSMTKAGINAFTKSLSKELAPSGIRVNSIAPGLIDTQMNNNLTQSEKEEIVCYLASKRMGETKDIASLAAFLLSDDAQYINGQIITIDGGFLV